MEEFKNTIKAYLDKRAQDDAQFAESYAKPGKSITDCCNYILNQAQKRGSAVAIPDEEVYGMAVHYYDEDIPASECRPISGARAFAQRPEVELTDEEKAKAKEMAMAKYREEQVAVIRNQERAKKAAEAKKQKEREEAFAAKQLSLFDL